MNAKTGSTTKSSEERTGSCAKHGAYTYLSYLGLFSPCHVCELEKEAEDTRRWKEQSEREALDRTFARMNLHGRFRAATFDTFQASTVKQRAVLKACRNFADKFTSEQGHGLWLIGSVGTGKTHLGAAIAQAVQFQRVRSARMMTCREVIRELRNSWQRDAKFSEAEVIEELGEISLLVLDEVGNTFGSDAELLQLYDVIDERYKRRRPTVVISNFNVPAIKAAIGDRLYDRLREGAEVLACDWSSHRSAKPLGAVDGDAAEVMQAAARNAAIVTPGGR